MPLDLGHDPVRRPPALRLIAEAGIVPSNFDGRRPTRADRLARKLAIVLWRYVETAGIVPQGVIIAGAKA
jgi:hypothetical protein